MAKQIIYWSLKDSAGTDWYVYPENDLELVITDTEPTDETGWEDYLYEQSTSPSVSTAASGIKYIGLTDSGGTTWYVYPDTTGELIITDTEPS